MTTALTLFDAPTPTGVQLHHGRAVIADDVAPEDLLGLLVALDGTLSDIHWWMGDAFNALQTQVVEDGLPRGEMRTLRLFTPLHLACRVNVAHAAKVSRLVPVERRVTALSWSHHALVAELGPSHQERWLARSLGEDLTTRQLAFAIDAELAEPQGELPDMPGRPEVFTRKVPPTARLLAVLGADRDGWVRWRPATGEVEAA